MSEPQTRLVILWKRPARDSQRLCPSLIELEDVRAGDIIQLVPIDDEDAKVPHTFDRCRALGSAKRIAPGPEGLSVETENWKDGPL